MLLAVAGMMSLAMVRPGLADPVVPSATRLPICGDQGDGTARLQCPDLVLVPDIQTFQLPGHGPVDVAFDFVFAEVSAPNELGFFRVDDVNGTVGRLSPAEPGYLAAALSGATILFPAGSTPQTPAVMARLNGGDILVFFIVHNGSLADLLASNPTNALGRDPLAFFSLARLNPDQDTPFRGDHLLGFRGTNSAITQFAFEDLTGQFSDWDFDDVVYTVSLNLAPPSCGTLDGDGDGVADLCDVCPAASNSDQRDTDGDGVGDVCDNCRRVANFGQSDADGNGRGDACSLEDCADGRDNNGDGFADGADPDCSALRIERVVAPSSGTRSGKQVLLAGPGFTGARGSVEVGGAEARVSAWRKGKVKFRAPQLSPGVYLVQAMRGPERSDRGALFVREPRPISRRRALREVRDVIGETAWWSYFAEVTTREPNVANVFQLREAVVQGDAAERDFVTATVRGLDATAYGDLGSTTRALGDVDRRFLCRMPDALLEQFLACTEYPAAPARFRLLPPDAQLRILNTGAPAARTNTCFVASPYYQESLDALRAAGVGDRALDALGY